LEIDTVLPNSLGSSASVSYPFRRLTLSDHRRRNRPSPQGARHGGHFSWVWRSDRDRVPDCDLLLIEAVDFDVTTKGELRAEARRQAVGAARRKAELYAEAAGVRLGAVLHIDHVDPERVGFERYRGHGTAGEASPEDLAPGHVVVSAAVILGFSINHD
jgi:uncharacterized protein DUF541